MLAALALALAGATVGIRVEEIEEIPLETAMQLAESLGRAIEARAARAPVIDDPVWGACRAADRCLAEVRARTGASELVLVKMFGALRRVRLVAERFSMDEEPRRFEINVPIERASWGAPLDEAARALFPAAAGRAASDAAARPAEAVVARPLDRPAEPAGEPPSIAPWVLVGAGAAALVAGSIFGLSSRRARSAVENEPHTDEEVDELTGRLKTHGWTANILFAVSGAAIGAGLVLSFAE